MTRDELLALPPTVPLWPIAGHAWGLGRNMTYELATLGQFPCKARRFGSRWVVVTEELLESLGIQRTSESSETPAPTGVIASATDVTRGRLDHDAPSSLRSA